MFKGRNYNQLINNVSKVIKQNLCVSCGICKAVCPCGAIEMRYKNGQFLPLVNNTKCTNCGNCLLSCCSYNVEIQAFDNFDKRDIVFGKYKYVYTAYSLANEIRLNSTSGGLITHLSIELLKNNVVDVVCVLPFNDYAGKEVKIELTNDIEEIKNAAKSKYCPASVENIIETIQNKPDKRLLIIGTPCQFYGIKYFIKKNKLNKRNYVFFGLMCDSTMNFNFLEYIKDVCLKKGEEIILFEYRTKEKNGWPGDLKIVLSSNKTMIIPGIKRVEVKNYFKLNRCNYCFDKVNIQSDITFGDCYIKGDESKEGKSSIIVRTEKGDEIITSFSDKIFLKKETKEHIVESQFLKERYKLSFLGAKYFNIYKDNNFILNNNNNVSAGKIQVYVNNFFSLVGTRYKSVHLFIFIKKTVYLMRWAVKKILF